jgi:hypothetical protein
MNAEQSVFKKIADRDGETYYCPMGDDHGRQTASEPELDDCVEATTAGRYSGNIAVVDRFAS